MSRKDPGAPAPTGAAWTPTRLVTVVVLVGIALVFIIQNNQVVTIRLLVPVVALPLWVALTGVLLIGVAIGYALNWRRR